MVSIAKAGGGQGNYYLELARGDYYLSGGEPLGQWWGPGSGAFSLYGEVKPAPMRDLIQGVSPNSKCPLVQNAESKDRQGGWDITFSAPKGVSLLWMLGDIDTRSKVQEAHREAVKIGMEYFQEVAGFTRRGKDGKDIEQAKLIAALFEHGTSRAQDPQLHTHAFLFNLGLCADGSFAALRSMDFFQHKMAAGAVYRVALAEALVRNLGVQIYRATNGFDIGGISEKLCGFFSKRRNEIEEVMKKLGLRGAVAAQLVTLSTRKVKEHVAREVLIERWQNEAREHGWTNEDLEKVLNQLPRPYQPTDPSVLVNECVKEILVSSSYFTERELLRRVADASLGSSIGLSDIRKAVATYLASDVVTVIGIQSEKQVYATRETLREEQSLLDGLTKGKNDTRHLVAKSAVTKALAANKLLSDEQREAVTHITAEAGSVKLVAGMAGTGKSTMLKQAREIWEKAGFTVFGASISGKAAQGLQESAGIKSKTLTLTLMELNRSKHRKVLFPSAPKWSFVHGLTVPFINLHTDPNRIGKNSILVVDEAGMVGTNMMKALLAAVTKAGAKLVLVGDAKQLQPIDAGGPFYAAEKEMSASALTDIRRQKHDWAKEMVKHFAAGRAKEALQIASDKGLIHCERNGKAARAKLIEHWKGIGVNRPADNLILAGRRAEVAMLNQEAQAIRKAAGKLSRGSVKVGDERIHAGDRVLFTANDRLLGVQNGSFGTVKTQSWRTLTVILDGEKPRLVTVPLKSYEDLQLGYAVTTHKAQGMTSKNAFVLIDAKMQDRELTYVQASRASNEVHFYTDRSTAGKQNKDLVALMSTSKTKLMATTFRQENALREAQAAEQRSQHNQHLHL